MVETKSTEDTVNNWKGAIPTATSRYKTQVSKTSGVIAKSIAAEDFWGSQTIIAIGKRAREKGLAGVTDEKWRTAAVNKGGARIGPGMTESESEFRSGIAKVLDVIRGVTLAPRTADPDTNIDNRVKPIARALHALKE